MERKLLSIFVDEAGDAGPYIYHSPYYVVSFVFHNQQNDISELENELITKLDKIGYKDNVIHTGPIIRNEKEYYGEKLLVRQKIFKALMSFFRNCPILIHSIYVEKKQTENRNDISNRLSKMLSNFMIDNLSYFQQFDEVIVYYDNGQGVVNKLISQVFPSFLNNVSFMKVFPSQYRLFQIADILCTLKHIELKMIEKRLSKSEMIFFDNSERVIKKRYLKVIHDKELT